jgi:succinate--hydroxymethylglutarate CoA-transferase
LKRWTVVDLVTRLDAAQVPCSPVNNMQQVFNHRQALHRGMVQAVHHPDYGDLNVIGPAVKYSNFNVTAGWTAPPVLGEHTEEVIAQWLGRVAA